MKSEIIFIKELTKLFAFYDSAPYCLFPTRFLKTEYPL